MPGDLPMSIRDLAGAGCKLCMQDLDVCKEVGNDMEVEADAARDWRDWRYLSPDAGLALGLAIYRRREKKLGTVRYWLWA